MRLRTSERASERGPRLIIFHFVSAQTFFLFSLLFEIGRGEKTARPPACSSGPTLLLSFSAPLSLSLSPSRPESINQNKNLACIQENFSPPPWVRSTLPLLPPSLLSHRGKKKLLGENRASRRICFESFMTFFLSFPFSSSRRCFKELLCSCCRSCLREKGGNIAVD